MALLQLEPYFSERVWGGQRLRREPPPVGEAWVVYEDDRIASGPWAGRTLGEVAAELGARLLGSNAVSRTGTRFPLLIKLLDCADWLSVQVHPDDEQARRLEGPEQFGKTEAWYVLEAEPGARLIAGTRPGTTPAAVADAIRAGQVLDLLQYHTMRAGDTVFMPAGTLHALGPGLLMYEVQETSDLTYRVYDWDRPADAGRELHIEQSAEVARPSAGRISHATLTAADGAERLVQCPYFTLELLAAENHTPEFETRATFHALTVIDGQAEIECAGERLTLRRFETVVISADSGRYRVHPAGPCRWLKASVE